MASALLPAITGGIGLARSLFGGHRYKYHPQAPFSYTPDPNDAERALRRKQALQEISADQAYTTNEIGRAGLLGSGQQFQLLDQAQRRGQSQLEGIDADVYAKRRAEALDQYNATEEFNRKRALLGDQAGYQEDVAGLEGLGDIGSFLGGHILDSGSDGFHNAPGNLFSHAYHSVRDFFGPRTSTLENRRRALLGYDPTVGD